jgi:hypothetical protein
MSDMNGTQMLEALEAGGFDSAMNGHLFVVTDVFTSRLVCSVIHPAEDDADWTRSVTMAVSADLISMQEGLPFAGFSTTVFGSAFESWDDLLDKGLQMAYRVASAHLGSLFTSVGFDMNLFMSGVGADMDPEERQNHLERRVEHAAMRKALMTRADLVMDGEIPSERTDFATAILESGFTMLDAMRETLTAVDGQ